MHGILGGHLLFLWPNEAILNVAYALEFSGGKGRLRAQGGLDVHAVHDAVLDVMEGSEDAFRKRREKYGF